MSSLKEGFSCISHSITLPQTGFQPGIPAGGSIFHESIALNLGIAGEEQFDSLKVFLGNVAT
jgi:hypothetical protein